MVFCLPKRAAVSSWWYGAGRRNHKQESGKTTDSGSWSPQWDSPTWTACTNTPSLSFSSGHGIKPCLFPASLILASAFTLGLEFSNPPQLYASTLFILLLLSPSLQQPDNHDNFMRPSLIPLNAGLLTWEVHGLAVNLSVLEKPLQNYSFAS